MKKIIILILLTFPIISFSQKITKSEYDKFIKKYRIETSTLAVKQGLLGGFSFGFSSLDSTTGLLASAYGRCSGVVGKDDKVIFLLSDDNTVEAVSKKIQFYDITASVQTDLSASPHNHLEYSIPIDAIKTLQSAIVKALRIYNNNGYIDIKITSGEAKDINTLAIIFLKEFQERQSQFKK